MEISLFKSRLEEVISELEKQADKLHDEFIAPEPCTEEAVETYFEYNWYNFINTACNQINKIDDKLDDIYKFIVQEDVHEREGEVETPNSEFGRQLQKISDKIDHIYALVQDIHSSLMGDLYPSEDEATKKSSGYDRHFDIIIKDAMNALYALKSINTFVFNLPVDADSCTCDKKLDCCKE